MVGKAHFSPILFSDCCQTIPTGWIENKYIATTPFKTRIVLLTLLISIAKRASTRVFDKKVVYRKAVLIAHNVKKV